MPSTPPTPSFTDSQTTRVAVGTHSVSHENKDGVCPHIKVIALGCITWTQDKELRKQAEDAADDHAFEVIRKERCPSHCKAIDYWKHEPGTRWHMGPGGKLCVYVVWIKQCDPKSIGGWF